MMSQENIAFTPREAIETECDRFNFETPGKIQAHGALIVLQESSLTITQLSQNTDRILGIDHREMINQNITQFLAEESKNTFQKGINSTNFSMINPLRLSFRGRPCDVVLHRHQDFLFLEVEPVRDDQDNNEVYQMAAMQAVEKFQNAIFIEQLMEIATHEIRDLTDFDRVMFYKFDEEYNGQVVTEATVRGADSFLHLHFPASDIPKRVRDLYTNTKSRYLPDLHEKQVPLFPEINTATNRPLDMSYAILRAVAPTHIEYMKNLGVNSSLSFTVMRNGRMYGMFACHHYSGKHVSYINRLVCEQIVEMFVAMLDQLDNDQVHLERLGVYKNRLLESFSQPQGMPNKTDLLGMVNADGAAIYRNGKLDLMGYTPDQADVSALIGIFQDSSHNVLYQRDSSGLLVTSKLSSILEGAESIKHAASGLMVIPISYARNDYIIWFRPERVITATWAGNPDQAINLDEKTMRVSPRKSFSAWRKNVEQTSEPWKSYEVQIALELRDALLSSNYS